MSVDIKVPVLPESVQDATVAVWHKKPGDACRRDESLVDIETDKVVLEVFAPDDGILESISSPAGSTVTAQQVIGQFKAGAVASAAPAAAAPVEAPKAVPAAAPKAAPAPAPQAAPTASTAPGEFVGGPAQRRRGEVAVKTSLRSEKRVPMTRLRARIAERLVDAQSTAAILTTFNEINMKPAMDLRKKYKDQFEKKHGVKLGFMSFFTKAVVEALKRFPVVNASIDGKDIVYHGYVDIAVAVSSPRGLVVPVLRNCENMSMADIELEIASLGRKAQDGTLSIEEMTGGTFTISNGGVFGSLMSTPILNPPQTGILGMHKIEERPVVEDGQIVIRPMMYVALSYDHRIIDGSESVRFLVAVKELLEDPARFLLDI